MKKHIICSIGFFLAFFSLVAPASASSLYFSPGSGNVGVGNTLPVRLNLNTAGEGVNGVSATVTYPADKLEVAYVTYGGAFAIAAEGSYGGGVVRVSRGSINPVSGTVTVATIGFRGKSLGAAAVAISGGAVPRATDSSDSYSGGSAGTFTVVKGSPVAPTGTATRAGTPGISGTLPVISGLTVTAIGTNAATLSWKTDVKTDTGVVYGLEKENLFLSSQDPTLTTDHTIVLKGALLTPGATFYYKALSKDASNNQGASEVGVLQLKGYTVQLHIEGSKGAPMKDTDVVLYSTPMKGKTDQKGDVVFQDVTLGDHLVVVKSGNGEKTQEIQVKDAATVQSYTIKADLGTPGGSVSSDTISLAIFITIGVLIVALLIFVWIMHKQKKGTPVVYTANAESSSDNTTQQ